MKVLITGGCGFLGSNISSFFLKKEWEIFIIDSLFREGSELNLKWLSEKDDNNQLKFAKIDISESNLLDEAIKQNGPFDYVVHVAGQVAMTTSLRDPRRDFETNVLGTFNLLESIRKNSPNSLIAYSSTNKVYGDLEHLNYQELEKRYEIKGLSSGIDEKMPLDFSTPYGCSKGAADQYVRDWARVFGLKTVVFRHSSIFGGRQFSSFDQGWIGWFCQKAIEQKKQYINNLNIESFTISGTGKQVRDVLHSDDLVLLYWKAFLNKEKMNGQIFNIGGGIDNSLSLLELFDILSEILNLQDLKYQRIERRKSDQDCFIANIKKARDILNWEPKIKSKSGIIKMLEWTQELK